MHPKALFKRVSDKLSSSWELLLKKRERQGLGIN